MNGQTQPKTQWKLGPLRLRIDVVGEAKRPSTRDALLLIYKILVWEFGFGVMVCQQSGRMPYLEYAIIIVAKSSRLGLMYDVVPLVYGVCMNNSWFQRRLRSPNPCMAYSISDQKAQRLACHMRMWSHTPESFLVATKVSNEILIDEVTSVCCCFSSKHVLSEQSYSMDLMRRR